MEDPTRDPEASSALSGGRRATETFGVRGTQGASALKRAMRRARLDEAERTEAIAELRAAEIARLEMLQDALDPLLAEIPPNIDLFDVAIMPGAHPRLFIDMIGFVEIAPDRRSYRFVQDTRHGRIALAESENIDKIIDAITDYMAHRLLEREKALASDIRLGQAARLRRAVAGSDRRSAEPAPKWRPSRGEEALSRGVLAILSFLIEVLGSAAFFMLLAIGGWYAWRLFAAWGATAH
ncbi:hypothetical protein RZS28_08650 [Methylocapsa polymorpha]|uniref:Uncharacterized protein n=1 Tax=Methylocapsa polymorpha TaxID=3080828 RepID=A0ABZ0HY75_9HYPH|nr:hypothetical protein RZS28_08650 [Methylocapsa sp. RX1]